MARAHATTRIGKVGKGRFEIGRYTYGHKKWNLRHWGEGANLTVGSFCSFASGVEIILGGNHRIDWITTFPFGHIFKGDLGAFDTGGHPSTNGGVVIGNDVWIGTDATILSGVKIGDGAVIGGKSVVGKDVEPYEIVGGNPAKHLKYRFEPNIIELLLKLKWWDLPIEDIREIMLELCQVPTVENLTLLIEDYRKDEVL